MTRTSPITEQNRMATVQTWSREKAVNPGKLLIEEKKRTQAWIYWDRWDKVIFLLDVQQMDILTVRQLYNDLVNAQLVAQSKLTELKAEIEGKSSFMVAGITELRCRIHRQRSLLARIGRFCYEAKLIVSEYNRKNPQASVAIKGQTKASKLPSRGAEELDHELWMDKKQNICRNAGAYNKLRELLGTDFDQWERQNDALALNSVIEKARHEGIPDQTIETWRLIKLRAIEIQDQRKDQAALKAIYVTPERRPS